MSRTIGLSAALALPLSDSGTIDFDLLGDHANWCLANGCQSVTVFGTTGEGASLDHAERGAVIEALVSRGIETGTSVIGGISATSVGEAVSQMRMLYDGGCRAILLPPPFLYKGVSQEGVLDWYEAVLSGLGSSARDVILYHIPGLTAVPLSIDLVSRLKRSFPDAIIGVKDSSGDFENTRALIETHRDLAILVGDERYLAQGIARGADGSISGMANIRPDILRTIVEDGDDQPGLSTLVNEVLRHPVVPAVKALIAHTTAVPAWRSVRPPLRPLNEQELAQLTAVFDEAMPSYT